MKCVLYARVSTDRQAEKELSIPAQLEAMREYARHRDWSVIEEFLEPGASATTAERPELQRLLGAVRRGQPAIDIVLVHKIDRLARSVYDHATIRAVLKQHGARLASVLENVDETVSGELVENIMASIAQFYSANLSEEVKKGMRQKVLRGGWPHVAPLGYVQVRSSVETSSRVEIHPRTGQLVTRAFELYASGLYSPKRLVQLLAGEGLTTKSGGPLSPSHLRLMLQNPFYSGRIRWNGLDVAAAHRSLVTEETFDTVQRLLKERSRSRGTRGSLAGVPLRGLAICAACRGHMTAERQKRWTYYRCSRQAYRRDLCPSRFCNAERAHTSLRRICLQIQISRETARRISKGVRSELQERMRNSAARQDALAAKAGNLLSDEMQLTQDFSAGIVSPAEYATMMRTVRENQSTIVARQAWNRQDPKATIAAAEELLQLATSVWDVYERLSDRRRAELLRIVFAKLTMGPEGIVGFVLTEPFKRLQLLTHANSEDIGEQFLGVIDSPQSSGPQPDL